MSSYIRTKLSAIVLGVAGIGALAQIQNIVSLLALITPLGFPNGITKFTSEFESSNKEELGQLFRDAIKILFASMIIFTILIILLSQYLSILLLNETNYSVYIMITGLMVFVIISNNFLDAYLKGLKNINLYSKISVISSILTIVISIPLIYYLKFLGCVLSTGLIFLSFTGVSIFYLLKNKLIPNLHNIFKFKIENPILIKQLLAIGFAFIIAAGLNQLSYLVVRTITLNYLGIYNNGILQSILAISVNYFGVVFMIIITYLFPKFAELGSNEECNNFINVNLRYVVVLMVLLICVIYVFKDFFIVFLFSREFLQATSLLKYQFVGDFFKSLTWIFGLWYIPRMKIKFYIISEIIFSLLFVFSYLIFLEYVSTDIIFASISYAIAYFVSFLINFYLYKKNNDFAFKSRNLFLIISALSVIFFIIVLNEYLPTFSLIAFLPILGIWLIIVLNENEKKFILQKFNIVLQRIRK